MTNPTREEQIQPTEEFPTNEEFQINSIQRAEWLLRKLGNIEAEQRRVQSQAAAIVQELETDRSQVLHCYGKQLQDFTEAELARRGGRRKTLRLLQGTCSFRHQASGFRLYDTSAAMLHARTALLPVIRTVEQLDTGAYRDLAAKHFEETGVTLPGVETTPEKENFSITFGKPIE